MGRKNGQRAVVYMEGKESKPPIKEGEWMFCSLFVQASLLCSELLTAFPSVGQEIPLCKQLQGIQSDVLDKWVHSVFWGFRMQV